MLACQHSGFPVNAGVCIEAHDRAALERLLRYCAHPPFAVERLRKQGAALVYRCAKQHSEPVGDKRGVKVDELALTPLELIDRIAARVPPPRAQRHRYFGVLAPNSPLRAAVTARAAPLARNKTAMPASQASVVNATLPGSITIDQDGCGGNPFATALIELSQRQDLKLTKLLPARSLSLLAAEPTLQVMMIAKRFGRHTIIRKMIFLRCAHVLAVHNC